MNREIYYLNDNDEIVSAEEATHAIIRDEYSNGKVSEMFLDKDDIKMLELDSDEDELKESMVR